MQVRCWLLVGVTHVGLQTSVFQRWWRKDCGKLMKGVRATNGFLSAAEEGDAANTVDLPV